MFYAIFIIKMKSVLDEIIEKEKKDYAHEYLSSGIIKDDLNRNIWDENDKIKPEIRKGLIDLAKEYWKFLKINVKPDSVIVGGSIANYNWNSKSDIDLHLVLDYKKIDDDIDFVQEYMKTKKDLWEQEHSIKIKGFDVEVYGQSKEQEVKKHAAIYDLLKNKWVVEPKKIKLNLNEDKIKRTVFDIISKIDAIEDIDDEKEKISKTEKIKDEIRDLRQKGLNRNGEYGEENIAFKILRNYGFLENLSNIKNDAIDDYYSIEEGQEKNNYKDKFNGIKFEAKKFDSHEDDEFYYSLDKNKKYKNLKETSSNITPLNYLFVKKDLDMKDDKVSTIKDFISFVCDKLNMKNGVKVYLENGRNEYIATTASYIPASNENHIRCGGRAIIDILRSIAHELTHSRQRELGIFDSGEEVPNIGHEIEDQANSVAGIFIKDFTHNYGYDSVYDF